MNLIDYFKRAVQISSLVFSTLVVLNLVAQKDLLFRTIESLLFVSVISGALLFVLFEKYDYSNERIILNQVVYVLLIFATIIIGNKLFNWDLGISGLVNNFITVVVVFIFVKFILYSSDKKDAEAINQQLKRRKKEQSS